MTVNTLQYNTSHSGRKLGHASPSMRNRSMSMARRCVHPSRHPMLFLSSSKMILKLQKIPMLNYIVLLVSHNFRKCRDHVLLQFSHFASSDWFL